MPLFALSLWTLMESDGKAEAAAIDHLRHLEAAIVRREGRFFRVTLLSDYLGDGK
jgi:hypothetical protein